MSEEKDKQETKDQQEAKEKPIFGPDHPYRRYEEELGEAAPILFLADSICWQLEEINATIKRCTLLQKLGELTRFQPKHVDEMLNLLCLDDDPIAAWRQMFK